MRPAVASTFATRSGSKQFHGRGFYFFRDEALNANTFQKQLARYSATAASRNTSRDSRLVDHSFVKASSLFLTS